MLEAKKINHKITLTFYLKYHSIAKKYVSKFNSEKSAIALKLRFFVSSLIVSLSHNLSPRTRIRGLQKHLDECHISNPMYILCEKCAEEFL